MKSLDRKNVQAILVDPAAPLYGHSVSGYGPRIPTRYRIRLVKGGIRRVYVAQYGNSGTSYVIVNGEELTYDPLG